MSTKNKPQTAHKAGKRLTVPKGAVAYIVYPGKALDPELAKLVEARAQVIAEDKVYEFKNQMNEKSMNARIPSVDELAADIIKTLVPHSEAEQNQILARVLHRLKKHRRRRQDEQEHTIITAQEVLAEAQQADRELDQIVAGNFTIIE